jgi:hypothetical protein
MGAEKRAAPTRHARHGNLPELGASLGQAAARAMPTTPLRSSRGRASAKLSGHASTFLSEAELTDPLLNGTPSSFSSTSLNGT